MIFSKFNSRVRIFHLAGPSFLLLIFLVLGFSASGQMHVPDYEIEKKIALIERAHQGFYDLGYDQDYVRDIIMPGLRTERVILAPHFPERKPGVDSKILFGRWITSFPEEYEKYMAFLRSQHVKWRTLLSNQ